jgi:hypothetical protein
MPISADRIFRRKKNVHSMKRPSFDEFHLPFFAIYPTIFTIAFWVSNLAGKNRRSF